MITKKTSRLLKKLKISYFSETDLFYNYATLKKIRNRLLNFKEHKEGVIFPKSLPTELVVEPFNVCNLSCPLCPTGQKGAGAKKGRMALEVYQKIMEEIGEYLCIVYLQNWGEPTLYPYLAEFIELSHRHRVPSVLATNLNLMNDKIEDAILNHGLSHLKIELDGATQAGYEKFRRGGNLEKVIENARRLITARNLIGATTPVIEAACLVSRHNEHEMDRVREIAEDMGADMCEFYRVGLDTRRTDLVEEWRPQNQDYDLNVFDPKKKYKCPDPWKMISINWNGVVMPCCRIFDDRVNFGDVRTHSIAEIWNNEIYQSARLALAHKDPSKGEIKTICHLCMGNLNSPELEKVEGTFAIKLPD